MFLCRSKTHLGLIGCLAIFLGCESSKSEFQNVKDIKNGKNAGDVKNVKEAAPNDHDHASHSGGHTHYGSGPHGGSLIELGGDDYHAEIVLDLDSHALRVFLLKADAKSPLPMKISNVALTLDAKRTLSLAALPLDGETEGLSSRFELIDDAFIHELIEKGFLHGDLSVPAGDSPLTSHLDIHFEHHESESDHPHKPDEKAN